MAEDYSDEDFIYSLAWIKWGQLQYVMLFEEMAELQKAITKELRGKGEPKAVIEEIADVQIMLDQFKLKYGKVECEQHRQAKLARLRKLLDGEPKKGDEELAERLEK